MSVAPDVTRAHVEEELDEVREWAERHGWAMSWRPDQFLLDVTMRSIIDGEQFELEVSMQDYRALPPIFEFIRSTTGERGTLRCYPKGGRGYFHPKPLLCTPWNRKAYRELGGPHSDWGLSQWQSYRRNHVRLGDMLSLIQELLNEESTYQGRMA